MRTTCALLFGSLLLGIGIAETDAHADLLGDLWSYLSGAPSAGQVSYSYPPQRGPAGYQYQVTYHGPRPSQGYQTAYGSQYGRYTQPPQSTGSSSYQSTYTDATGVSYPNRNGRYPGRYSPAPQQRLTSRTPAGYGYAQPGSAARYGQSMPIQPQSPTYQYPYGGQPYYGSYANQRAVPARSSAYASPYQYSYQGWNTAGMSSAGRT